MTEAEREEIIRQLLKLLDHIEAMEASLYIRSQISIAKGLVRKLSPSKSDGGNQ